MIIKITSKDVYGNVYSVKYQCDKCDYCYSTERQAKNCDCKMNQKEIFKNQFRHKSI